MNMYEVTMTNATHIGNKTFANVPIDLLFADPQFQRITETSNSRIQTLVNNWDANKMDALKVSPHPETGNFSIINGYHRFTAAKQLRQKMIEVEIVMFPSEIAMNPAKRLKAEAKLFATQNDEVHRLSPSQKHNANLILGVQENVVLQKVADKHGIILHSKYRNNAAYPGYLTGFDKALEIAKVGGEQMLDDVFAIIKEGRWILNKDGLRKNTLSYIYTVLRLHQDRRELVVEALKGWFRHIQPTYIAARGGAFYPMRTPYEQKVLVVEDYLHEKFNEEYRFLTDDEEVMAIRKAVA